MADEPIEEVNYWILSQYHKAKWEEQQMKQHQGGEGAAYTVPLEDEDL